MSTTTNNQIPVEEQTLKGTNRTQADDSPLSSSQTHNLSSEKPEENGDSSFCEIALSDPPSDTEDLTALGAALDGLGLEDEEDEDLGSEFFDLRNRQYGLK